MATKKPEFGFVFNEPKREEFEKSEYYFDRDEKILRLNLRGSSYGPSIEDFGPVMSKVIGYLRKIKEARSFVLVHDREYEYNTYQTHLLQEIAEVMEFIRRRKLTNPSVVEIPNCGKHVTSRVAFMQDFFVNMLPTDPVGAYVRLKRYIEEMIIIENKEFGISKRCYHSYISRVLEPLKQELEKTELIQKVKEQLPGYHIGNREVYRQIFHPTIRPNFMLTRYQVYIPENGNEVDHYELKNVNTEVRIFRVPGDIRMHYHVIPPEFNLNEEEYAVLDTARRYMSEHEPTESEFAEPERTREVFFNIGKDMILDILASMELEMSEEKVKQLATILTRYTAGLGILEILLADPNLQDIYVNSPIGRTPVYAVHGKYGECITNLIPTGDDAESWATRFRMSSGRPLDEANPVLDTEAEVPGGRARVAIITRNLSPEGLGFAFRRHREKPWTFPLFIKYKAMNPLAAGLLSFIIQGSRTMLIAGTRSSGKTSLLSACLTELMKKYRICTVEDTLELPLPALRELGYNVERMKSRSVITQVESELSADEAIRTALRLGDSVLIIGEVRSLEARALYEAMRIGALANFVGGTIHGDSAYGVFDRVVNDLGVPPTSFKATDIIVIVNTLKSPDGLHTFRRITNIVEVRKEWSKDPLKEKAFVDLMIYDAEKDELVPTDTLLNGESFILNSIANNVREWKNNWNAVWNNILLRSKMKETIVKYSEKFDKPELLEAEFVVRSNERFHELSEKVKEEFGILDPHRIFALWTEWLKRELKIQNIKVEEHQ